MGTTPFPNHLLDELMPKLRDTEWRLVCVVARQTLGWKGLNGGRKAEDWLTHAQLKRRTNRAAAAVSQGLDRLVRQGIMEVRSDSGIPLNTADQRRRERGRLYYRLHPRLLNGAAAQDSMKSPVISLSEFHKAKTTKENGTKGIEITLSSSESETIEEDADLSGFLAVYRTEYQNHFGLEPPEITTGDLSLLAKRLNAYGPAMLEDCLRTFLGSDMSYATRNRHSLDSFLNSVIVMSFIHPSTGPDSGH